MRGVRIPAGWRGTIVAALLVCGLGAPASGSGADGRFTELANRFLTGWLARRPQIATRLGDHSADGRLELVTPASVRADVTWLKQSRDELRTIQRYQLSLDHRIDYDLLRARIERELIELEDVRSWERNPNYYLDLVAVSVQSLLHRDYAPISRRVHDATLRLRRDPEILRAAQINLKKPPRAFVETAISQYGGALRFYRETVPALTRDCHEPQLHAELAEADTAAVRAVQEFIVELREDFLPQAGDDVAIGAELYARKLAADEMETAPIDSLLARGYAEIARTRARMDSLAEKIAPGAGVRGALAVLERDAPTAERLVPDVRAGLDSIRKFVRARGLLTMPAHEDLRVRETPVFRRALTFASMEAPGVWDKKGTEAYFNVTPAEPDWSEARQREHLAFFNRWSAAIVTIHEALPGHYYQALATRSISSRLRQAFPSASSSEGWAHYCEQLAIEQDFGGGDPRYALAQQLLALQRLGRLVVGISINPHGMTLADAQHLLEDRCLMAPANAEREARRGTSDPTYLVYTLGKWRLLELRDECRRRLGARFSLKKFHDAFLRQGPVPLPLARLGVLKALTGE